MSTIKKALNWNLLYCLENMSQSTWHLMLNRLKKDGLDPELYLQKMTRAHLNRGAIALWPQN